MIIPFNPRSDSAQARRLATFTVAELKAALRERRRPVSGRKGELVARLDLALTLEERDRRDGRALAAARELRTMRGLA
jgi:hypothetical protein